MIDKALKDIEDLMAREELRQAWKDFVTTWAELLDARYTLWDYGYRIALLSDNPKIQRQIIASCERMLKTRPRDSRLLVKLATLYDAMEAFDKSLPIYQSLRKQGLPAEERRNVEYNMAMIFVAKSRLREAKVVLSSALRKIKHAGPMFTPYYGLMGKIEGRLGRWRAATSWYDKAIRYDPAEASWPRLCATLLEDQGQHGKAIRYWDLVLAIPRQALHKTVCDPGRGAWKSDQYVKSQKLAAKHRARCAAIVASQN